MGWVLDSDVRGRKEGAVGWGVDCCHILYISVPALVGCELSMIVILQRLDGYQVL